MDGIVNQLRVTKGVRVAVFLYENEDHTYKASFRVNGDFDAASLAMHFGGGGHVKAAGCTLEGELSEIIDRIVSEIQKRL
jgi:phosphoesterase RecJ-like protein